MNSFVCQFPTPHRRFKQLTVSACVSFTNIDLLSTRQRVIGAGLIISTHGVVMQVLYHVTAVHLSSVCPALNRVNLHIFTPKISTTFPILLHFRGSVMKKCLLKFVICVALLRMSSLEFHNTVYIVVNLNELKEFRR